jgi:predicted HicB family RNase H-like nuclease
MKQPGKHTEEIIKTTLRLPRSLSDAIKHLAIDQGITLQELTERAMTAYLKKAGRR